MYLYNLYGWEENVVLTHDKEFTKEKFENMCKKVPSDDRDSCSIQEYLITRCGFKTVKYTAGFDVDEE